MGLGLPVLPARPIPIPTLINGISRTNAMNETRSAYACLAKVAPPRSPPAFHARTRSDELTGWTGFHGNAI